MSADASAFGFGKFIPGFDFLQGLAQGAGTAASPLGRVSQWVAPTVSVEEVDKRITELKAVLFWLEQNGRALTATIQALEVQRMTLSTLKDMNVSMSELAQSFQFPAAAATAAEPTQEAQQTSSPDAEVKSEPAAQAQAELSAQALGQAMQWWGALTQQFQQIATKAMAEPVPAETMAAAQRATEMASGFAQSAMENVMAQAGRFSGGKDASARTGANPSQPARKASAAKTTPASKSNTRTTATAKKPAVKKGPSRKAPAKTAATRKV